MATKPFEVKNSAMLKDAIGYLDPHWIRSAERGKGALIGMVAAIMATKGLNFKRALATVIANIPEGTNVEIRRVPEHWRDDWREIDAELGGL